MQLLSSNLVKENLRDRKVACNIPLYKPASASFLEDLRRATGVFLSSDFSEEATELASVKTQ